MNKLPWELNPDLEESRLIELANVIANVRHHIIELHDPKEAGDTPLVLGTRTYECSRIHIIRLAGTAGFEWLSIPTQNGRFTFSLGGTPVRFSRNDPEKLPDRKLVVSEEAAFQMSLLEGLPYADIRWFIVFDTDCEIAAEAVYFVGYSERGDIVCQWEIPIEEPVTILEDMDLDLPKPVELDEPAVGVKLPLFDKEGRTRDE